jgi:hypothetical protein
MNDFSWPSQQAWEVGAATFILANEEMEAKRTSKPYPKSQRIRKQDGGYFSTMTYSQL